MVKEEKLVKTKKEITMSLSKEEKEKFMKIIEDKKNKGSIIKSKQRAATTLGSERRSIKNKKTGGVFDK